jgi:hypothetical protein
MCAGGACFQHGPADLTTVTSTRANGPKTHSTPETKPTTIAGVIALLDCIVQGKDGIEGFFYQGFCFEQPEARDFLPMIAATLRRLATAEVVS